MNYTPTRNVPTPAVAARERENMWLEEQFWGHRLWDQQSPWLTFLEFLCVAASAHRGGHLFDFDRSQYPSEYTAFGRVHLRNILFNNEQQITRIADSCGDNASAWDRWLTWIDANARGLDAGQRSFRYLRERFESFHDFATLIKALRSCVVEGNSNKRWSSRFIFPFGPAAIFEDLSIKDETLSRDYVNFGRSGELLYHMVARSHLRAELREIFPSRVLDDGNKWNQLIERLQPPTPENGARRGVATFLPYDSHPVFDLIAEDWLRLLQLRLPGFDVIPYLVNAGAFGLLLYQLHTSAHIVGGEAKPSIICEVVAPRKGLVRELSTESFEDNSLLSVEALDKLISRAEAHAGWNIDGSATDRLSSRRNVLEALFRWSDENQVNDPDDLLRQFRQEAKERHRRHFGQVHRSFGRGIGLVSKRGTNRFRYAPSDHFLKCLIFANVKKRIEFSELLAHLYDRYGLVFGEREAERAKSMHSIDKKPFQQNALRLEHRLGSLGLLKRLSDACAYVENPYAG
ncbi:hypothetical protein VOI32_00875 [Paraburkholderia caribensis]|uniref:Uncharacterized protein n=2 Tax=Paraburkholderia caribensis TaxID=75105 RepID=A0ABV0DN11_9BURK|nr:hypothetical protein [Paraburkholderia caribensis]MCO4875582.1 hypothetical protein [Paraburkholderia caribensis]